MTKRVDRNAKTTLIEQNVLKDTAIANQPKQGAAEIVYNNLSAEFQHGAQAGSYGWLHSPTMLELLSMADARLTRVSDARGKPVKQVEKVRAAKTTGNKKVYLIPADDGDTDAIEVKRYDSSAFINLKSLLGPTRLSVRTGFRERYAVEYAGEDSPVGQALVIDLSKRLERREESGAKKTAKKTATATPAPESAKPQPTEG